VDYYKAWGDLENRITCMIANDGKINNNQYMQMYRYPKKNYDRSVISFS